MTQKEQLGKTLWDIADNLRGAMNADDFRDYMLSFLFLRYLSYNYEESAKKKIMYCSSMPVWILKKKNDKQTDMNEYQLPTSDIFYCQDSWGVSVSTSNKLSNNLTDYCFETRNQNIPPIPKIRKDLFI